MITALIALAGLAVGYIAGRIRSARRELALATGGDPFAVDLTDDPIADELAADLADARHQIAELKAQLVEAGARVRVNELGEVVDTPALLCGRPRSECLREAERATKLDALLAERTAKAYP